MKCVKETTQQLTDRACNRALHVRLGCLLAPSVEGISFKAVSCNPHNTIG